jgi:hypothetical protein
MDPLKLLSPKLIFWNHKQIQSNLLTLSLDISGEIDVLEYYANTPYQNQNMAATIW